MIRISRPGNDGFSLIESTVSIFIASVALCGILMLACTGIRASSKTAGAVNQIITESNEETETFLKK